jgi:hypothetical protein
VVFETKESWAHGHFLWAGLEWYYVSYPVMAVIGLRLMVQAENNVSYSRTEYEVTGETSAEISIKGQGAGEHEWVGG